LFLTTVKLNFSNVLGTSVDITSQELLLFTNQDRQKESLPPLAINNQLSQAAALKATDMFGKNYWAHNAPEGTTPWFFIKETGYVYVYAGENLARGFNSSEDVVKAWMASPSHRENMLSKNYQDVGFAVVPGKLNGEDTILVVEMFGGKGIVPIAKESNEKPAVVELPRNSAQTLPAKSEPSVASFKAKPLIDISALSRTVSGFILLLFISIFLLDMILIERKKIVRLVGHNIDHVAFLTGMLILVILISRGIIL